jgi:hypothetical protein
MLTTDWGTTTMLEPGMTDPLKEALHKLLRSLDSISSQFEFITDSTVRDRMSDFVRDYYLRRIGPPPTQYDFDTRSSDIDRSLLRALSTYVDEANALANERKFTVQERLKAFQDEEVKSDQGSYYDDHFGYWRPGAFAVE